MLYNLGMYIIKAMSPMAYLLGEKPKQWYEGRKGLIKRVQENFKDRNENIIWFHCASLGEFEQGRQLIEQMRKQYPTYKVLITFFSPSGYQMRCNYSGADWVMYMPIDTPTAARRFVEAIRPKIVIYIKYEFWRNMLKECRRIGAKVYVVSAIFRPSQSFFKWYGGVTRQALRQFDHIFVQNEDSVSLLSSIGINNVTVAGDTRFDRVYAIANAAKRVEEMECFTRTNRLVFVAGSTWPEDDTLILEAVEKFADMKFVIVPHEINKAKTLLLLSKAKNMGRKAVAYTDKPTEEELENADLFIVDTIGLLSSIYKYGTMAYIGGGFGVGIHNTLEAATFGLPIAFGPNYMRFAEAVELVDRGSAVSVDNPKKLIEWIKRLLGDNKLLNCLSDSNKEYVASRIGACDIICDYIKNDEK